MDKNEILLQEIAEYVPEGYLSSNLYDELAVSKAKGSLFFDLNKKKYIDYSSGIFTNTFGHCNKPLVHAANKQKKLMDNVHGRRTEAELAFYKQLSSLMPNSDYRFTPYNDGGYTIDRGLSGVINYYGKKRICIAAFSGGFHGKTMGTKLTINETEKAAFFDNFQVEFPNCYRCPKKYAAKCGTLECADDICGALEERNAKVLLFEPVQGAGIIIPPYGFWLKMEKFCKSKGIILFADEVLTGGGRTGYFLASYGNYGITPDIIALAKGLANGHPLSVLCERIFVTDNPYSKRPGERSSTFAAHPEGLAIGSVVLEQLKKQNIFSHVRQLEAGFKKSLEEIAAEFVYVGDTRCVGLMGAVEFVKNKENRVPFTEFGVKVFEKCRRNGLEIIPSGHIVRLAPPLNISEKYLLQAMKILRQSIQEVYYDWRGLR